MNFRKGLLLLISVLLYASAFAQFNPEYEIVYFGSYYKDKLQLNQNKNWYLVAKAKGEYEQDTDQIIEIDLTKDIRWEFDKAGSTYTLKPGGSVRKFEGRYLIGTYDTLKEAKYLMRDWGGYSVNGSLSPLRIGYVQDVNRQGFRDTSPYITFCVTGKTQLYYYYQEVVDYQMTAVCVFDDIAYYDVASFGGKEFKNDSSFHQSFNFIIEDYLRKEGSDSIPPCRYAYLMYSGYIDKDYLVDFVIAVNGRHYLFLTYQHDLDNGKIFHIERVWEDKRYPEF